MDTTLVIMAAGIGSRFGKGIKQLARVGQNGELIMDYSIYDAVHAGFNKVVFVIRRDIEEEFRRVIGDRIEKHVEVKYVLQELHDLPVGFSVPEGRTKPWGTGQAVWCCRNVVHEPFVVINADDYYGRYAFLKLHEFLAAGGSYTGEKMRLAMAGFILKNTLSRQGAVTRGICVTDEADMLTEIRETTGIRRMTNGKIICDLPDVQEWIHDDVKVSMNMWAADPGFLYCLQDEFQAFLTNQGEEQKSEFLLPTIVGKLLEENRAAVKVLETSDRWIGITYQKDMKEAQRAFSDMVIAGKYPAKLWTAANAE